MEWFAVSTSVCRDPSVAAFARAVGIDKLQAVGHLVSVWAAIAEHGDETGFIRDTVDEDLEEWALWRGAPGAFAVAFRAHFQDPDGTLHAWERRNGAMLRKARLDAERKRRSRTVRGLSVDSPTDSPPDRRAPGAGTRQDKTILLSTPTGETPSANVENPAEQVSQSETPAPRFADRRAHLAYTGFRRAHSNPEAFELALSSIAEPLGGNGFGWDVVGTALAQMAANGVTFNEQLLRGYCRRIVTPPPGFAGVPARPYQRRQEAPGAAGGVPRGTEKIPEPKSELCPFCSAKPGLSKKGRPDVVHEATCHLFDASVEPLPHVTQAAS